MLLNKEILNKKHNAKYPLSFPDFFTADPAIAFEAASLDFKPYQNGKDKPLGKLGVAAILDIPGRTVNLPKMMKTVFSNEMTEFVSSLSGTKLKCNSWAFNKWESTDFLGAHGDSCHGATMILYLSPYWCPSWGGILEFSRNNGPWGAVAIPKLGTASFCMPDPEWKHRVTPVNSTAPFPRIAVAVRFEKNIKEIT